MTPQTGKRILITGAGGFIGHHLAKRLVAEGHWVRGVDTKRPEYEATPCQEFQVQDLVKWENCLESSEGMDQVYALAANMGGIGFIETHKGEIVRDNTLISLHTLEAAARNRVQRLLYTSSACVYPISKQQEPNVAPLKEDDAYPADPEDGYGWEKLYSERLCRHYSEDFGLETRVVRFHNIYGPLGTYDGGREKSPAAICRKVALAEDGGEIEVWGNGTRTRSYAYIDDCVEGLTRIMGSTYAKPLNLGTDQLVSINQLVNQVAKIAGKSLRRRYDLTKPQGVVGRNSDNDLTKKILGWAPSISLEVGLRHTYAWIEKRLRVPA